MRHPLFGARSTWGSGLSKRRSARVRVSLIGSFPRAISPRIHAQSCSEFEMFSGGFSISDWTPSSFPFKGPDSQAKALGIEKF